MMAEIKRERLEPLLEIFFVLSFAVIPGFYQSLRVFLEYISSGGLFFRYDMNSQFFTIDGFWQLWINGFQLVVPIVVLIFIKRESFKSYGFMRTHWLDIGWGFVFLISLFIGLVIVYSAVIYGVSTLFHTESLVDINTRIMSDLDASGGKGNTALLVLLVVPVIFHSFGEELVFRSFLFKKVNSLVNSNVGSALIVNLVFASCHFYQGINGFVVTFILGMVLSLHYIRNGNIYTISLFHGAKNLIAFLYFM